MIIDYLHLLQSYGGVIRKFEKRSIVYREGEMPLYFYCILEGEVKVFTTNSEGKDFVLGLYNEGESFGESSILLNKPYLHTAQTNITTRIMKLSREVLWEIIKESPELSNHLLMTLANRCHSKSKVVQMLSSHTPHDKILRFLKHIKGKQELPIKIPYTRRQIAEFTGLRVETVIRTLIQMNKENRINIVDHKVYY